MNNNVLSVMKKEFARFFRDPRMVVTALILPGLLIYLMYTFMGNSLQDMLSPDDSHIPVLNAVNIPADINDLASSGLYGFDIKQITNIDEVKTQITNKETDILIVFDPSFINAAESYDPSAGNAAPNIEIYYNATNPDSTAAFELAQQMFRTYEDSLANRFDVNRGIMSNLATEEDLMAFSFASMLPFLLLTFMFTGCMSLAPESIAGEKERGTIATILVTPIKRSELAIGKILSLGILAFLCGISSAIGTFISLPNMMGAGGGVNINIYTPADYALIILVILATVLLIVTAISIISAFSKTVKEASTAVMPLMAIVMLVGITSMFGGKSSTEITTYMVPLYNSVQAMGSILKFEYDIVNLVVTIVSNLVYACIGGVVLTRMFNSERIIFSR